jgi:hypothetical protein
MPWESGSIFERSGGWIEHTALRFLDANGSWCDREQKQAITICKEVLSGDGWSETVERRCEKTLVRIVDAVRDRQKWHDGQAGHHRRVLRAWGDSTGRQIKLAASAELWAYGKRKWSHDSSQGTEKEVVIRRRVVEETVVMSHRHVSRSGTE